MTDVAARAGVSIATVSRALRGVPGVSETTRQRILGVAEELSYVVSPEASRLARGRTGRVAVVMPRVDVWFYAIMLASIEQVVRRADMDLLVYQVDGERERERFLRELPARRKVDAVILAALPMHQSEVDRLDLMGVHVVVAGGRVRDFPHVEVDDHDSARTAVEHLVAQGHRRVAMLRTSDTDGAAWGSDVQRTRGWRDTLAAAGLDHGDDLLLTQPYSPRAADDAVRRLRRLNPRPTALFCYSDELTIGALGAARRQGLRVPDDLALIGVDGHPATELLDLTTVDQDVAGQGRLAGQLVLDLVSGRDTATSQVVPTRLRVRGSSQHTVL